MVRCAVLLEHSSSLAKSTRGTGLMRVVRIRWNLWNLSNLSIVELIEGARRKMSREMFLVGRLTRFGSLTMFVASRTFF